MRACTSTAGTLEAFLVRDALDDYLKFIDEMGIGCLEISDGSMVIDHDYKCELIQRLSKEFKVLSEVGSKEEGILISPAKWIKMMRNELDAGSFKVIAEARERNGGHLPAQRLSPHQLIRKILANVDLEDILWEAPKKPSKSGLSSNLAPMSILATSRRMTSFRRMLRVGLRGDTFFHFLPDELKQGVIPQEVDPES